MLVVDPVQAVALAFAGTGLAVALVGLLPRTRLFAVVISALLPRAPSPPRKQPDRILFQARADPASPEAQGWEDRVGHVQDLMTAQDAVTWTAAGISFAAQAVLAGFFFQASTRPLGQVALPVAGVWAAAVFLFILLRSNWYMSSYMNLLQSTGREEYDLQCRPRFPPSATVLVNLAHIAIAIAWVLLLGWVVFVGPIH